MFTGIVEDVGTIKNIKSKAKEVIFTIGTNKIDVKELQLGESVSVNGTCLTVIDIGNGIFSVEASHETLEKTDLSRLKAGSKVNLERALKMGDRMGGHIVNGHIDGVGKLDKVEKKGESIVMWFSLEKGLSRYVVEKGCVAVDGVSLTINKVNGNKFSVNIIPYTQEATIFREYSPGTSVNIECDIVGKYIEKFLTGKGEKKDIRGLLEKL